MYVQLQLSFLWVTILYQSWFEDGDLVFFLGLTIVYNELTSLASPAVCATVRNSLTLQGQPAKKLPAGVHAMGKSCTTNPCWNSWRKSLLQPTQENQLTWSTQTWRRPSTGYTDREAEEEAGGTWNQRKSQRLDSSMAKRQEAACGHSVGNFSPASVVPSSPINTGPRLVREKTPTDISPVWTNRIV